MGASIISKAALCVCPSAALVTAALTVAPVRHVVHRATAPHHLHHEGSAKGAPLKDAPCVSVVHVAGLPSIAESPAPGLELSNLNNMFDRMPAVTAEDQQTGGISGYNDVGAVSYPSTFWPYNPWSPVGPNLPVRPTPPLPPVSPPSVPEPANWMLMIVGFSLVGLVRRRVRRRKAVVLAVGGLSQGGLEGLAVSAKGSAVVHAAAMKSTVKAGVVGKALLCVCPPALLIGGVASIPAARSMVHYATMPAPLIRSPLSSAPCTAAHADL